MKKLSILIILLAFSSLANAQTKKLIGSWLMTKAETPDGIQEPYFITDFNENGTMVVMGMEAGTWKYDKKKHSIVMESELDKDFNGEGKILNLNKTNLVVSKDGAKLYYTKVDADRISECNKNSGLIGKWKFKDQPYPDVTLYLTFTAPDEFSIVEKEPGVESRLNGTWIFDKEKMSLIMIGLRGEDNFNGMNTIVSLDENKFILNNKGQIFTADKIKASNIQIERLTFTEDDFYTEDGDYKYEGEEEKLPWSNYYDLITYLENVNQLVYKYSVLIEDAETFESKTLKADVSATLDEERASIDFIFNGYDRYNLPDDTELRSNENYSDILFPLKGDTFRISGEEEITTPAGTFQCLVLEIMGDFDTCKKAWMIKDKPGVYAKIIEDQPGNFGHYSVYELQEIKKKN